MADGLVSVDFKLELTAPMSAPDNTKTDSRVEDVTVHDEGLSKRDEATIAVAEEHSLSIWQVIRYNKRIVWWCFFFSMSAIGW